MWWQKLSLRAQHCWHWFCGERNDPICFWVRRSEVLRLLAYVRASVQVAWNQRRSARHTERHQSGITAGGWLFLVCCYWRQGAYLSLWAFPQWFLFCGGGGGIICTWQRAKDAHITSVSDSLSENRNATWKLSVGTLFAGFLPLACLLREFRGDKPADLKNFIPVVIVGETPPPQRHELIIWPRARDCAAFTLVNGTSCSSMQAFARIKGYIDYARSSSDVKVLSGGGCDDR